MPDIVPALYIMITEKCDMCCGYCPEYGENWEATAVRMDLEDVVTVLEFAREHGVTTCRLTGGEPFLDPDRTITILRRGSEMHGLDMIVNTNGTRLAEHVSELKGLRIKKMKVSLDTVDRALFRIITGTDRLDSVLKSIAGVCEAGINTELNMVVTKTSVEKLEDLINFSIGVGASLKLLDLVAYEGNVKAGCAGNDYWQREYFDVSALTDRLTSRFGAPRDRWLSGGRGVPMAEFRMSDRTTLTIKDSRRGTSFGGVCRDCSHYPCQEGLFHVALTAGGSLRPCRLRGDLGINLRGAVREEIDRAMGTVLTCFRGTFFRVPERLDPRN